MENLKDNLDSGRRFVLGQIKSSRLELDFFNLYAWLLRLIEGKKVLDVACGSGLGSFLLAHKAEQVLGIDLSEEVIAYARERYSLPNLQFEAADIFDYHLPQASFDVIVSALTIEQMEPQKQEEFLRKLKTAMAPGALMILVTPNKKVTSPSGRIGNKWNEREFSKSELEKTLRSVGLEPLEWFGQRAVFFMFTTYFFRKILGLVQKVSGKNLGFYGRRESSEIKKLKFYRQPKEFVVLITKK